MNYFFTCLTILCVMGISIGQMLFKKAAMSIGNTTSWQEWAFNFWLISAFLLYGVTTLAWVWVLRHAPLGLAYPFMGLAFIIVPCLGWLFLGEPMRASTLAGGLLILAGIAITAHAS
ncbi:MAG: hypothetical protein EON54_16165 [Alcaligenaceae bacterium]|nr:MAG: hypothetical protein EON54_16165 [Alcaligenaceae bacterium]